MFNMLSGGAVQRMAIFALGIMPYISASIIMQLMQTVIPELEALKKEGEAGRKKLNQYTRYGTVVARGVAGVRHRLRSRAGARASSSIRARSSVFTTVITLTGGTILLMWMGEQITSRGVGNGISLIIFVGIVARFPTQIIAAVRSGPHRRDSALSPSPPSSSARSASCSSSSSWSAPSAGCSCNIPSARSATACSAAKSSHLPLKLNVSGVIPPIFASSILTVPLTYAAFAGANTPEWLQTVVAYIGPTQPLYFVLYGAMIIFFAFFYTSIVFNPEETAENLKKYGGFIPGIRPGKKTAEYIDYVLTRTTVRRRALSRRRLPHSGIPAPRRHQHPVARRHVDPDHRQRHDGHDRANPEPPHRAAI